MLTQEDLPTMHFSECVPLLGDTVPSPLPSYADHGFIADVWVVAGPQRPRLRLAGWLVGHGLKSRSGRLAAPQESGHMPDLCLHRPRGCWVSRSCSSLLQAVCLEVLSNLISLFPWSKRRPGGLFLVLPSGPCFLSLSLPGSWSGFRQLGSQGPHGPPSFPSLRFLSFLDFAPAPAPNASKTKLDQTAF